MKPDYFNIFLSNKEIYKYANLRYKKANFQYYLNKKIKDETNEKKKAKFEAKVSSIDNELVVVDNDKVKKLAILLLDTGFTHEDFQVFSVSSDNLGLKRYYLEVKDLVKKDPELSNRALENKNEIDKRLDELTLEENYLESLSSLFGEKKALEIISNLKDINSDIREEYIKDAGENKANVQTLLESKQDKLEAYLTRLACEVDFSSFNFKDFAKVDELLNEILKSYIESSLSFTDLEKNISNQLDSLYKPSKMEVVVFNHLDKYDINHFIIDYTNKNISLNQYKDLSQNIYNFCAFVDPNKDSKELFDSFMLLLAKSLFNDPINHVKLMDQNVNNLNKLILSFNLLASDKGLPLIKKEDLTDSDIKNYLYNLNGSKFIQDEFSLFLPNENSNYIIEGHNVDDNHFIFKQNFLNFKTHMASLKQLQNTDPIKSFSIDMEVYRKNYNFLKNLHESRNFFFKFIHPKAYKNESRALKEYVSSFIDSFHIVGSENEKTVRSLISSTKPLLNEDKTNKRFVSNDKTVAIFTFPSLIKDVTRKFKITPLDIDIEKIEEYGEDVLEKQNEKELDNLIEQDNIIDTNSKNEDNIDNSISLDQSERSSLIIDELNNINTNSKVNRDDEFIDFVYDNRHYNITRKTAKEIDDYVNPKGMGERDEFDVDPEYVKEHFLKGKEIKKEIEKNK